MLIFLSKLLWSPPPKNFKLIYLTEGKFRFLFTSNFSKKKWPLKVFLLTLKDNLDCRSHMTFSSLNRLKNVKPCIALQYIKTDSTESTSQITTGVSKSNMSHGGSATGSPSKPVIDGCWNHWIFSGQTGSRAYETFPAMEFTDWFVKKLK
jgi:hypothetical protein